MSLFRRVFSFFLCCFSSAVVLGQYSVCTTDVVPLTKPMAGHFYGELNNQVWAWGGYVDERGMRSPRDTKFNICGLGASVDLSQGTLCIGGTYDGVHSLAEVFLNLKVSEKRNKFSQWEFDRGVQQTFPSLPVRLHNMAAAFHNGYVYVFGGQTDSVANHTVYRFRWPDGTAWDSICVMPGEARIQPIAVTQWNAVGSRIYLLGGSTLTADGQMAQTHSDGYCFNCQTLEWTHLEWPHVDDKTFLAGSGAVAYAAGRGAIVVMGGQADDAYLGDIRVYNTLSDSWSRIAGSDTLARKCAGLSRVGGFWFMSGGETAPDRCTDQVTCVEILGKSTLSTLDWAVLVVIALLFVSLSFWKRSLPLDSCLEAGGKAVRTFGFAMWLLPTAAFAWGSAIALQYLVVAALCTFLADGLPAARWRVVIAAVIRILVWTIIPAALLATSLGTSAARWVGVIVLLPGICLFGSRVNAVRRMEKLQCVLLALAVVLAMSYACLSAKAFPAVRVCDDAINGMWPAAAMLFVAPLVMAIGKTQRGGFNKRFFLFALGLGVALLLLGGAIYSYYQMPTSVMALNLRTPYAILPSFALNALPQGLAAVLVAALVGQSWCVVARELGSLVKCFGK